MASRPPLPKVPPPPKPPRRARAPTGSGLRPTFQDTEAKTPRENVRVVTYGEIAELMDRAYQKTPVLPLLLLELDSIVLELSPEDAELVLRVASRLKRQG